MGHKVMQMVFMDNPKTISLKSRLTSSRFLLINKIAFDERTFILYSNYIYDNFLANYNIIIHFKKVARVAII